MRIGFGFDVHELRAGNKLVLGGAEIKHDKGCVAHSDGDVLIHAICDALLGAAAMRDIGYHFPDNDPDYKDISSIILLKKVVGMLWDKGYEISNIDTTISAQKPKLAEYIPLMIKTLSDTLEIDPGNVSVKATTTEGLGFIGKEEGIGAYAVVLLEERT